MISDRNFAKIAILILFCVIFSDAHQPINKNLKWWAITDAIFQVSDLTIPHYKITTLKKNLLAGVIYKYLCYKYL